ncbi:CBS domain-containing protein [Desulfonatronovibrio hydrogenovorans]|uniref:CBS domain-containing protein n=1 Tax=Desulfonatronovibrio hydrogenovorans TaxID=53245 RepID=UPI00048C95CE|nr:CBS domain-containing protein [Desulfonatronovibrio hydrogenovorans]
MLYRKRAWDMMHSEFAAVDEEATLSRVIQALEEVQAVSADNDCVIIMSREGRFVGIISIWDIIKAMGPVFLKKAARDMDQDSYERAFELACKIGGQAGIKKIIQKNVPRIRPNDTLARIMEVFLDYAQKRAVVEEGGKVMGIVTARDVYQEIARNV